MYSWVNVELDWTIKNKVEVQQTMVDTRHSTNHWINESVDFFIVKIVEVLCSTDADEWQWLHDQFKIYLPSEPRQLHNHITPHYYSAFKGNGLAILILDLQDGVLNEWGELIGSEWKKAVVRNCSH